MAASLKENGHISASLDPILAMFVSIIAVWGTIGRLVNGKGAGNKKGLFASNVVIYVTKQKNSLTMLR